MPEKILYYLGAGASAKALPLAKTVYGSSEGSQFVSIPGLAHEPVIHNFCPVKD